MNKSHSFIATPPGATIKEQLCDRGLSQKEFALRMDMSEKHISKLINGEVHLTDDVAVRLETVLGVPARFWSNLEALYREKLIKVKDENEMEEEIKLAKKFPYREMAQNSWVPETRKPKERVNFLRRFFEVVHLGLLNNLQLTKVVCRRLGETEKSDFALLAWVQKAKIEARSIETKPINLTALKKSIPAIRKMTKLSPEEFCPQLMEILADCGIALIFLPHIGGSFLHGATFCDGNKIVVGLTVRGKDADKFWFSLFHELGHILLGHIHEPEGTTEADEEEANEFARETLIAKSDFERFIAQGDFHREAIYAFAESIEIDCGIVVGRLQKEGYIEFSWYNDMKTKYSITV